MNIFNIDALTERVSECIIQPHLGHCLRTAETAREMAVVYREDEYKAYVAGLLHDYTKSMSNDELLGQSRELGLVEYSCEETVPYLLHAKLAARLVERDFDICDSDILGAIEKHTYGAIDMNALDKIIYVADMIEPERPYARVDELRQIAFDDLDEVFKQAYELVVDYLVTSRKIIHPVTVEVWNNLVLG